MTSKDSFSSYHPFVSLVFFVAVTCFAMFILQPVCLVISLSGALTYAIYLNRGKAVRFTLMFMLPLVILAGIFNALFSHQGVTILGYLYDGNPLTFESIVYGLVSGVMLVTVITWFSSFNVVITTDKIVYLFGRIIPALSLVISMVLRLVPRYKAQAKVIAGAQRCVGRDPSTGNIFRRARSGIRIVSILVTWALENGIETADSMKSRGYGIPGRTAFSLYPLRRRDLIALGYLACLIALMLTGSLAGALTYYYIPMFWGELVGPLQVAIYIGYFALCFMPMAVNLREDLVWRRLLQKT
ncbi:MAG: energy-coupling factor transporter transmembrane protein EcfT [Coriobacteriales bacterium]|jgi:energy-coupling factor transport system permease protein|nr:energy-coupling factor transporter transmembrane protein EcfT [Coriobacteriales bacterium]